MAELGHVFEDIGYSERANDFDERTEIGFGREGVHLDESGVGSLRRRGGMYKRFIAARIRHKGHAHFCNNTEV